MREPRPDEAASKFARFGDGGTRRGVSYASFSPRLTVRRLECLSVLDLHVAPAVEGTDSVQNEPVVPSELPTLGSMWELLNSFTYTKRHDVQLIV
jgi:hypothetical protein